MTELEWVTMRIPHPEEHRSTCACLYDSNEACDCKEEDFEPEPK